MELQHGQRLAVIDEIGVDLITDDQQVPLGSYVGH